MKRAIMNDIWTRTKTRGRIFVPGGWQAWVPEVELLDSDLNAYAAAFMDEERGDALAARRRAARIIAAEYGRCRIRNLRLSVAGWARKYSRMYPDLCEEAERKRGGHMRYCWILRGFDPERIQACFLPDANTGRRGNPYANRMLAEMAHEARGAS